MTPTPTTSTAGLVPVAPKTDTAYVLAIPHVFMPQFLPADSKNIREEEAIILQVFNEVLQVANSCRNFPHTARAFSLWDSLQENLDPGPMLDAIQNLLPGESLPVYLREQNCGIILSATERDDFMLSTFRASLGSEAVTSAEGNYASVYPSGCVVIPRGDIVQSRAFLKQLQDLDLVDLRESVSVARKAQSTVIEKRDVADPLFVTKWLTGTLANERSRTARLDEIPRVIKKIRDRVVYKEGMPFRRAGIWMVIKVTLNILLVKELGDVGHLVYKIILLKFMTRLAALGNVSFDSLADMSRKIAHRAKKVESLILMHQSTLPPTNQSWVSGFYHNVLQDSCSVLKLIHDSHKKVLEQDISTKDRIDINLRDIKLWIHLSLKNSKFSDLLAQDYSMKGRFKKVRQIIVPIPATPPRHRNNSELFSIDALDTGIELGTVLYDFERNVSFWKHMLCSADGNYVWEMYRKYISTASEYYKGDPLGSSRYFVTLLKMLMLWDKIVCDKIPQLREHKSDIDVNVIRELLVRTEFDLHSVEEVEHYFTLRNMAPFPSLIDEGSPTVDSFANRYAMGHPVMDKVRQHLLEHGKQRAVEKLKEVHEARAKCERLEAEGRKLECEYVIDDWKRRHNNKCQKCQLSKQERNMSVQLYEAPLPVGLELQNAVVFELLIPPQIAVLRDILFLFNVEVGRGVKRELYGPWHDYFQVRSCSRRDKPFVVSLMSSKKLFLETHYRELHPRNPDEDFVRANGYNLVYSGLGMILDEHSVGFKSRTTFKVEKKSRYSNMQWGINGGTSQNEVIARQSECHLDMSLTEFVEFGSLRSEYRLQWRNLFRALSTGSLSLKEESVYSLICQTMWELGISDGKYLRMHQKDFEFQGFSEEWLGLLDSIRKRHVDNWKDHYVLLTIIFLTQMISTLNKSVESLACVLLDKCRHDAVRWSEEIQKILSTLSSAPREEVDALRVKLVEVNCCVALTFTVGELYLYELICSGELIHWLLAVARIHDNLVLLGEHKLRNALICLLRRVNELGVFLEPFVAEAIRCGDLLTQFVYMHYAGTSLWGACDFTWDVYSSDEQVYYCDVMKIGRGSRIQMDIIKGCFLIDGCPVGYLPQTIENHRDFKRVFGGKSFEVQPYPFQPGRMITRDNFGGSKYSFYLDEGNELTVIEHRDNDVQVELISEHKFDNNVPHLLVEGYTHWYNYKQEVFEFFPKEKGKLFGKAKYILELKERFLYTIDNPNIVAVDVSCPGHSMIIRVLSRLESGKYMSLWCTKGDSYKYTAELPRMGLQFSVRNVDVIDNKYKHQHQQIKRRLGDIVSQEYRGMRVSFQQGDIGCLHGITMGLLLEDADVNSNAKLNSIILFPHVLFVKNDKDHGTYVETHEVRSPPFFAFEIDTRLKLLKAGECRAGWIYLAYLHAITNRALPDQFTGVTGYERAMEILQSGVCFSSEPLDEESYKTLMMIRDLAPIRGYYPPGMRQMETAPCIANSPYDAYYLVVDKLISDSMRLSFLHPDINLDKYKPDPEEEIVMEKDLALKAYWRNHYVSTETGRLQGDFLPPAPKLKEFFESNYLDEKMLAVIELSQSVHSWKNVKPSKINGLITSLLLTGHDLKGVFLEEGFPVKEGVHIWGRLDFRDYWLDLYNLARKVWRKDLQPEWSFLITYLSFRTESVSLDHLRLLQTIAVHWDRFDHLDPPEFKEYSLTNEVYCKEKITTILKQNKRTWESYLDRNVGQMKQWETELEFADRMKPLHEEIVNEQCDVITQMIDKRWPCEGCDWLYGNLKEEEWSEINIQGAVVELTIKLKNWFRNKALIEFISDVESIVANVDNWDTTRDIRKQISKSYMRQDLTKFCNRQPMLIDLEGLIESKLYKLSDDSIFEEAKRIFNVTVNETKNRLSAGVIAPDFPLKIDDECPIIKEYMKDLEESWEICHKNVFTNPSKNKAPVRGDQLATDLRNKKRLAAEYWERIRNLFLPLGKDAIKGTTLLLVCADIHPRIVPLTMLKLLLTKVPNPSPFFSYLQSLIGAYAVLTTQEQKSARCVRYAKGKRSEFELHSELSNNGHENWNPAERPEWLLFEIEMDLMIRPVQAKVAERMESPVGNKNALIQLNMGEGKTFVIVPLLCLSLADGNQLCRVTVLKSLYQLNRNSLSCRVGGLLLNRRVYAFPCRRDFKIGVVQCDTMLEVYKECVRMGGVVMTLPEYRLSFELKAYERCHVRNFDEARAIFKLQEYLKTKARDVLDESDEILHVKYQLIYTLGKQMPVGGGCLRWNCVMDLLTVVPEELEKIGSGVEFQPRGGGAFPYCRVLKLDEIAEEFTRNVAERVISGNFVKIPEVSNQHKELVMQFLTVQQVDRETLNKVLKLYETQSHHQETLLVLRGLLACGVLVGSLNKRWRVNYGVSKGYRRMAVPFRAKDVASERTEFGHPDVALLLTLLSYYYSGLSDEELEHCFVILYLEPNPAAEYSKWISLLPKDYPSRDKISNLSSVNLNDFFQKQEVLFPALKYNTNLINFWLGRVVFPQESKQFGWKIGCSPWDLCGTSTMCTTGFSGTNDSKILLPKTVEQRDLDELKGTNGSVLRNLLLTENDLYEVLDGFSGVDILKKLVDSNIRVLLDVGALMLELDNGQVARKWLQLMEDKQIEVDACVYFDDDKLVVVSQNGAVCPFELSTFRNRLDRCVIYLDDSHTRGTDLKIPMSNVACVTLGKGVTKDKLVQGCMRMRKLGVGHRVVFWASGEVDSAIREGNGDKIGSKEVLLWAIKNNQQQVKDGFIHWASAGVYQAQKLSSLAIYKNSLRTDEDLIVLAENCSQKEQIDLRSMYGDVRTLHKFPVIVGHLLKRVNREIGKLLKKRNGLKIDCDAIVQFFGKSVVDHSEKYVSELMRSTQLLDEEQERELEHELEAQHEKQLPNRARPRQNSSSVGIRDFILTGRMFGIEKWAVKIPLVLKNSSIWSHYPSDSWGKNMYASMDFAEVIINSTKVDDFLRPVQWFCLVRLEDKDVILLLSSFEVDLYLDMFKRSKASLHMYSASVNEECEPLHLNSNLVMPRRSGFSGGDIDFDWRLNSALILFSGGCYFVSKVEQEEYCKWLGFCPRPRGEKEEGVFLEGGIVDGWVKKEWRQELGMGDEFKDNPEGLVRVIVLCRFGLFNLESHVGKVVVGGRRPLT